MTLPRPHSCQLVKPMPSSTTLYSTAFSFSGARVGGLTVSSSQPPEKFLHSPHHLQLCLQVCVLNGEAFKGREESQSLLLLSAEPGVVESKGPITVS